MSPYAGGWSSRSCFRWGLGVLGMTVNEDEDEDEARVLSRGEGGDNDEDMPSTFKMTISSV